MKKIILMWAIFACGISAYSASFHGEKMALNQPDGSKVDVLLFGTEFFMRAESVDGYTLIVDPDTKWICYASKVANGELISSGIPFKASDVVQGIGNRSRDLNIKLFNKRINKNLRYGKAQRERIINKTKLQLSGGTEQTGADVVQATESVKAVTGTIKQLAILVEFPDRLANITRGHVENAFNSSSYNDKRGSVKTWSKTMSNNMVTLETFVIGYYRAKYKTSHYLSGTTHDYSGAHELRAEVMPWADSQFDFSTLTTSGTTVKSINILYAGDVVANGWANSLWPHASSYTYNTKDGVKTGAYFMSNLGNQTPIVKMSTMRHELGHSIFGWPDTYDYESDSYSAGGFAMEKDLPCAPFRAEHGWINVIDINNVNKTYNLPDDANTVLKYTNPNNSKEYFMIEYVRKSGWRDEAPDEGLLIWHVDEAGNNSYQDMTASRHYRHSVEQADGLFDLENHTRNGSDGDLFHGGYRTSFNDTTGPNAKWWNGSNSGLKVSNIGNKGGSTMSLTIGSGGSDDNNTTRASTMTSPANGTTLAGSSVTFKWKATTGTYHLYVGTSVGGNQLYSQGVTGTQTTVSNLPTNGSTVYVRLWTKVNGSWKSKDYTYITKSSGANDSDANKNYVKNGSFEGGMANWNEWGNDVAGYVQTANPYKGSKNLAHWRARSYEVGTYQDITGIPNGTYKALARVKSTGGQTMCKFYVNGFNSQNTEKSKRIWKTTSYKLILIKDIEVTNGKCSVAVYSKSKGGKWATFDNITLIKQ